MSKRRFDHYIHRLNAMADELERMVEAIDELDLPQDSRSISSGTYVERAFGELERAVSQLSQLKEESCPTSPPGLFLTSTPSSRRS
ncbi:MAG TPA: hypothetical protein VKU87_00265 [Thermomicrobiaceae bacterium]|nr:hypothetical protein [Thermomicrobiaceae bacterium]